MWSPRLKNVLFKIAFYVKKSVILSLNSSHSIQSSPIVLSDLHYVSKNDTDVAHCNFDAHQSIRIIFGRDVAESVRYQMVICYTTSPLLTNVSALPWET